MVVALAISESLDLEGAHVLQKITDHGTMVKRLWDVISIFCQQTCKSRGTAYRFRSFRKRVDELRSKVRAVPKIQIPALKIQRIRTTAQEVHNQAVSIAKNSGSRLMHPDFADDVRARPEIRATFSENDGGCTE